MYALVSVLRWISGATGFLGGLIMLLMMLQISLDVVLKYALNWPVPATLETVSNYYMVALIFLPLGLVTRDREHLEVELFTQGLSDRRVALYKSFGCLLGVLYVSVIFKQGLEGALYATRIWEVQETAIWDIPTWPSRWFVPIGAGLMWIFFLIQAVDFLKLYVTGSPLLAPEHRRTAHEAAESAS